MLQFGDARKLAADCREPVRALATGQELQPVALQPAIHRDRQACTSPLGTVVECDTERGAQAVLFRELQRQRRAEHPRIREARRRDAEMLAESLAAELELRSDQRAQRSVIHVATGYALTE